MHITLTVPNLDFEEAPLMMMRELMLAFRRLRRLKLWKDNVKGGCYGLEVTNKGNGWHPHLHIVADCQWLALHTPEPRRGDSEDTRKAKLKGAAAELQSAWQFATGYERHMSLWLRRCDANAASEIVGYALKSEDSRKLSGRLGPIFRAMDKVRMCSPFGSCFGLKLPEDKAPRLMCPNGHADWSTTPTAATPYDALDRRQKLSRILRGQVREYLQG